MFEIFVRTQFSAAHHLKEYPGACRELHGHNWTVEACVAVAVLDEIGIAYDFKKLKQELKQIVTALDHHLLNELAPFQATNPTAENIAAYIFHTLKPQIAVPAQLVSIRVNESDNYSVVYSETGC